MARTARASVGGLCYHVINRGNRRARVYHDARDYRVFVALMRQASQRVAMRIAAWCLMPNHFHLVLWPVDDGDLGRWMHWLLTSHVRRHHRRYGTDGRIWQGRFKAFPIQQDAHLWTVMRYVERNPLRAHLVPRAENWPWSSLRDARRDPPELPLCAPLARPERWSEEVNAVPVESETACIRESLRRSRPFGGSGWVEATARTLGLESSLRRARRPGDDSIP